MIIQKETFTDTVEETLPLLIAHWEEVALRKDVPLEVVWPLYYALEKAGSLQVFTVRREGEIVGYSWFFVRPHPHYKSVMMASNDVLFLRKDARQGWTGVRLIKFAETSLKAMGVNRIAYHLKYDHDFSRILTRLGYTHDEFVMGKYLG